MHPDLRARAPVPDTGPIMLLDRYELVRSVGQGGMADVYEGWDHQLQRRVAVKVLRERETVDPAFVARFLREASATAGLGHPNVAAVFDAGSDRGLHFIVMEFVAGRTLREVLEERGRLPVPAAAAAVAAAATALGAAHAAGLVHRDVKPGNIMVTPDAVKVVDFGIARAADADPTGATTNVLGTPSYMSPEQAQGARLDARSDVYGLGVCLYELLTGVPPFTGDNAFAIAYQHVNATPRPPSELRPDLPAALEAVILRAMAKDPDRRYQTAAGMRAAIEAAMAAKTRTGSASGTRAAGAKAGALATVGASTVPSAPVKAPHPPPARRARRARGRRARGGGRRVATAALAGLVLAAVAALAAVPALRGSDVFQAVPPAAAQVPGPSGSSASTTPGRMPYLRGLSLAAARAQLRLAGVSAPPAVRGMADAAVPAGLVLASSPAAGTAVGARTPVTLVVSLGAAPGTTGAPPGTAPATTGTTGITGAPVAQAPGGTTTTTEAPKGRKGKSKGRHRPRPEPDGRD
jgi:hypothetical protein